MRRRWKLSFLLLACAMLATLAAMAQTTGGSLQGKVTDASNQPVIGATIKVTGPAVQGFLGGATDVNGEYHIPFVPAGKNYTVQVEASGFNSVVRSGIEVPLGTTISLPFQLGQGTSTITVVGAAPVIDYKQTTTGGTISDQVINSIPLSRGSGNITFLAPSAVNSGPSTPGDASISGSTGAENNYIVNGLDITNTAYGTNVGALNFDFIQAMEVLTGGLPPEYGYSTGGVVNAITKSGSNDYHGGLSLYYFNDSLQSKGETYSYVPVYGNAGFKQWDLAADLGGYIIKDKLWFYTAVDYNKFTENTLIPVGTGDAHLLLNGAPAESVYTGKNFEDTNDTHWMYATKFTWSINQNHKLSLSIFGDPDRNDSIPSTAVDTLSTISAPVSTSTSPYNLTLEWDATWTPKFFSTFTLGYRHRSTSLSVNSMAASQWAYSYYFSAGVYGGFQALPLDNTVAPVSTSPDGTIIDLGDNYQVSNGAGGIGHVTKDNSTQFNVKFTNLLGRHEFSYGGQYQNRDYTLDSALSGPTNWVDPYYGVPAIGSGFIQWGSVTGLGFPVGPNGEQYVYFMQSYFTPMERPTNDKDLAMWVNDSWHLSDYFTLNLGLRYDQQKLKSLLPITSMTVNGIDPSISGIYTDSIREISLTGNYAPRLGFTWDVAHNGKSKLYGFAGRYFERVPTDMALRSLAGEKSGFDAFYDPNLTVPAGFDYPIGFHPEEVQGITPGLPVEQTLRAPYTDEYIAGFEYEVRPDLKLGVRAVYRSLGRTIEDISVDGANTYIIANPDAWTNIPVPSLSNPGQTIFFPKPTREYKALEFTISKRFSDNWQFNGSWVHSSLRGNYEGASSNDTTVGQLDPNLNATYDLPDLLANGFGYLPLDRSDVIKAYGSYKVPGLPLELSGDFNLQTGTPISKQLLIGWYGGAVGFAEPRGSAGRTPTTWALDLGGQYDIKLFTTNLGLRLDLFNLTNNQKATAVYQGYYEQALSGGPITDVHVQNNWGNAYLHQAPRAVRLAIRWTF